MRRQGGYAGSNVNPLVAAQMQHIAAQRMQHNPGMSGFPGRPDDEEQRYMPSNSEGHWHWEGIDPNATNMPAHMYKEGQGPPDSAGGGNMLSKAPDGASPFYQGQIVDAKSQQERPGGIKDIKGTEHEKDIISGYQDLSVPQTLEQLEQKFLDEIMQLTRDLNSSEDEEVIRHQERTREINLQYQERLSVMRAQQSKYREDILRQEAEVRQQQYQTNMKQLQNNAGVQIAGYNESLRQHDYGGGNLGEGQTSYPGGYDSYRDRVSFYGDSGHPLNRNQSYDARGSYPGGRTYDPAPRYY